MASNQGNTLSEPAKMEQIITEFFAKSLHIILESRSPYMSSRHYSGEMMASSPASSSSSSSSIRHRDKWFNLALRDCPAALEHIDFWRQSNLEPMVVDVVLMQRPSKWVSTDSPGEVLARNLSLKERYPYSWNLDSDDFGCEGNSERIVERWIVHYESRKNTRDIGGSGSKRSGSLSSQILYKKSILLLRSLYVIIRLLPAYKIFRDLNSSGQVRTYNLVHKVSSFAEPFTRREEADMQRYTFTPVDTACGRICISVLYRPSVSDASSGPSTPMSPQFIPDYIGSPMADRLKRLPSNPMSHCSPSSSPFGRRHSWSYDLNWASPPSALPSPSPTYSDSRASISKFDSNRPPLSLPRHLSETPQVYMKNMSYDEYWPSPIFSPSPSPSPPPCAPGSHISKVLLRSDSAPLSIPSSRLGDAHMLPNKQILLRSPTLKATRPSMDKMERDSGLIRTVSTVEKLFPTGKDETGRLLAGKLSSNSSPQKSFSRTSSGLSFEDNYDDSEFSGPFVVDDDDMTDASSRPGSFDQTRHPCDLLEPGGFFLPRKSQDAAVGALVQMLKKAPPLHQDLSQGPRLETQEPAPIGQESVDQIAIKTTADALAELRGYREMKELLIKQAGKSER